MKLTASWHSLAGQAVSHCPDVSVTFVADEALHRKVDEKHSFVSQLALQTPEILLFAVVDAV